MQTNHSGPSSVYKLLGGQPLGISSVTGNPSFAFLPHHSQQSEAPQDLMIQPQNFISIPSHKRKRIDQLTACYKEELENLITSEGYYAKEKGGLTLTEQMQLEYLSKELEVEINGDEGIEDVHEVPGVSAIPDVMQLECNRTCVRSVVDGCRHSKPQRSEVVASNKQRIRWMPELHELFLKAVDKLGGPESATPKNILKIMNVAGLNIYHVKSHLQKYRLAKNVSEMRHDKRSSRFEEKAALTESGATATYECGEHTAIERNTQVLETLKMQVEVQKLLHQQLQVQRELQLQIEQQGHFLRKLMEEQKKAPAPASPPSPTQCFPSHTPVTSVATSSYSTQLPNHEPSQTDTTQN